MKFGSLSIIISDQFFALNFTPHQKYISDLRDVETSTELSLSVLLVLLLSPLLLDFTK